MGLSDLELLTRIHVAGGCAGAASRTVVSPLERLKIIQYVLFKEFLFLN